MIIAANPLVTVIIPSYNSGPYLLTSVKSITKQIYDNLQIIVVDDGSTDNSFDNLDEVIDSRVVVITQSNSGKSVALNNALKIAKGKYFAIQDADDIASPDRISNLVMFMEKSTKIGAVFSGYELIVDTRHIAPVYPRKDEKQCGNYISNIIMPSHDPTGLYRLSWVKDIAFDPELKIGQGYDYIMRVGELYPMYVIDKCLYSYRINPGSAIRSDKNIRAEMVLKVWAKACARRGIDFENWLQNNQLRQKFLKKEESLIGIAAHCMESVLCLKNSKRYIDALRVGFFCCKVKSTNFRYYKPLIYALLPLRLVLFYRDFRRSGSG